MRDSIRDYVSEGATIRYEQLVNRFGEPGQIAATYVNEMETGELLESMKNGRKLVGIAAATAMIVAVLWLGLVIFSFLEVKSSVHGYGVVGEIEVNERIEYIEGEQ